MMGLGIMHNAFFRLWVSF